MNVLKRQYQEIAFYDQQNGLHIDRIRLSIIARTAFSKAGLEGLMTRKTRSFEMSSVVPGLK